MFRWQREDELKRQRNGRVISTYCLDTNTTMVITQGMPNWSFILHGNLMMVWLDFDHILDSSIVDSQVFKHTLNKNLNGSKRVSPIEKTRPVLLDILLWLLGSTLKSISKSDILPWFGEYDVDISVGIPLCGADMGDLFMEPFPGISWLHPLDFPITDQSNSLDQNHPYFMAKWCNMMLQPT
ncbi:Xyloglucan fucosyltransferase [Dillenia turbinata]|uniref:Fucosyltransferase n=1 Tax=Dillenia turbinata TaxID=194707 RepID=A0AAN8UXA8_9MAGN